MPTDPPDFALHSGDDVGAELDPARQQEMLLERFSEILGSGPGAWRVATSLLTLRDQVNALAPTRNKASDGTIGDARHQTEQSDHNPWVHDNGIGVVTALDITHDPAHGCDCEKIAGSLKNSTDQRIKYVIWNQQIFSSTVSPWTWRSYAGTDPHTGHVHISVVSDKAQYDDNSAWDLI